MDSAGIIPEEDEVSDETDLSEIEEISETSEERLSVFEDFLEQLNIDDDEEEEEE